MATTDYDYLIVGQGLAGTSFAWHLDGLGKKILIVGDASLPSSSKVAAGIFNPLTGKKLVKTWLADDLFPYANEFYTGMEKELHCELLHLAPIYRPFRSIEEQNTYLAQTADPGISKYISQAANATDLSDYVHAEFGGLEVIRSGWVDLPLLLVKARDYFIKNDQYVDTLFDVSDLQIENDSVTWKNISFGKVVFCQGFMALQNDFFNWLPFTPVKGQILEIATESAVKPYIINQGVFMLPVSEHVCRVGATYSWDPLDWEATESATEELESKLKTLIKIPYSIRSATAGIRPSAKDRRPLIGIHPEHDNIILFNGLGTKGVTLAPFFANQLVQHLENGKELNPLVNIKRYFSLYFR
jgi:glycine/D-amino acid oxidase-like deaminating enzyme